DNVKGCVSSPVVPRLHSKIAHGYGNVAKLRATPMGKPGTLMKGSVEPVPGTNPKPGTNPPVKPGGNPKGDGKPKRLSKPKRFSKRSSNRSKRIRFKRGSKNPPLKLGVNPNPGVNVDPGVNPNPGVNPKPGVNVRWTRG